MASHDLDIEQLGAYARQHDLALVVLFGSRARHTEQPGSDFDLALMPDRFDAAGGFQNTLDLSHLMQRGDLDVAWLPNAAWLLNAEVARDGVALYEKRPGEFAAFRLAATLAADSVLWRRRTDVFIQSFLKGAVAMNVDLVQSNLRDMTEYLQRLARVLDVPRTVFVEEFMRHHSAERLLELVVECAADVNTEIAQSAGIPASDYYSSFFSLSQAGWIPLSVAERLANHAKLRNALVHHYGKIDIGSFYDTLQRDVEVWTTYTAAVYDRLAPK